MLEAGCWKLDAGGWKLETGCWMLQRGYDEKGMYVVNIGFNGWMMLYNFFSAGCT